MTKSAEPDGDNASGGTEAFLSSLAEARFGQTEFWYDFIREFIGTDPRIPVFFRRDANPLARLNQWKWRKRWQTKRHLMTFFSIR